MEIPNPTAPDAEKNLIASVILDPALISEYTLDRVPPEAFDERYNRTIWTQILSLYWNDYPVDIPSVMEALRQKRKMEDAGGVNYLLGLMEESDGVGTHAYHYADTVMEAHHRRLLITECRRAIQTALDDGYEDALSTLQTALHEIEDDHESTLDEALDIAVQFVNGQEAARLPTGFRSIDLMIGGLPRGDLTILAGRTSMGKSALAHNIAFQVGSTHVLTPDQPLPEVIVAETCRRSEVPYERIRAGYATDEQKEAWLAAFEQVKEVMKTTVTFDDRQLDFGRMVTEVRRAARRGKQLVILDHVQHVRATNHKDKRTLMMDITSSLKGLARDEGIAILALSQLTRDIDHRLEKRPTLIDLSESKTLEEDANVVLFLYRDGYYHPESIGANLAEIIVGKSKTSARLNMAQLLWNSRLMQFLEVR